MAAVYQRQLSMPSLRGRLMSTSESCIPHDALAPYP